MNTKTTTSSDIQSTLEKKINTNTSAYALLAVLFIINPFFGFFSFLSFIVCSSFTKKSVESSRAVFILMTVHTCLIQSTRVWLPNKNVPSDWYNRDYWGLFKAVEDHSFFEYLVYTAKEPAWKVLNYVGYYITGGEYAPFINWIAMATITLTCTAVYRYWKTTEAKPLTLIASLALVAWSYELIGNMNNTLRYFFGLSIMMNAYVERDTKGKINWWLLISACLIHTASFLFAFFIFLKPLCKKIDFKESKKLLIVLFTAIILIPIAFKIASHIPALSYGVKRLEGASNPWDQNFRSFNMLNVYVNIGIILIVSLYINYISKVKVRNYLFTNVIMLIMVICIPLYTLTPELMTRIYISRLFFLPFFLPYFIKDRKEIYDVYLLGIILFWGYRFFTGFHTFIGGNSFPHMQDIMNYSLFHFLF